MPRLKDDQCGGDEQNSLTGAANLELSCLQKADCMDHPTGTVLACCCFETFSNS